MKKFLIPLLFVISLLMLSCGKDSSPTSDNSKTFKVAGSVTDKNGAGIKDVLVMIEGANYSTSYMTDSGGIFSFWGIKSGDYKIRASKDSCFFKPSNMELSDVNSDIDTLKFTSVDSYIHGKVLDIMTDKGIAGIKITFNAKKRFKDPVTLDSFITGSSGEYEFFDLPNDDYIEYLINFLNTNFEMNSAYFLYAPPFFSGSETIIPDYYFSSEKLQITKGGFSAETKTVYLEWTPSKSPYNSGYSISYGRYPLGYPGTGSHYGTGMVSQTNNVSMIINSKDMLNFYDENILSGELFFSVSPSYKKGSDYPDGFHGPFSESYGVMLSW